MPAGQSALDPMSYFQDKIAFITGAASGIGRAIAERFHALGARVVVTDCDASGAASVAAALGEGALGLTLDVCDRDAWMRARDAAIDHFGTVDVLVNNAGIGPDGYLLADVPPAMFDDMLRINVTGVFNGIHAFGGHFRSREQGYIINVASMAGHLGSPQMGAYTASKFAVVGLSEVLQAEMEPYGVGVTVLCPGVVQTNLAASARARGGIDIPFLELQQAMTPEAAIEELLDAVECQRLYAFSHAHFQLHMQARMESILDAFSHKHEY
jgi:NAD(P)-dependent dehydrogenase (short-subunit alcohol dehydrogenase family)